MVKTLWQQLNLLKELGPTILFLLILTIKIPTIN